MPFLPRFFATAGFLIAVHSALATDFYVSPSGDNGNPGTEMSPWQTIQKAADTVGPGDVVHIRGGVYEEKVEINVSGTSGNLIVFQSYAGEEAIIDGSNLGFDPSNSNALISMYSRSYLRIEGITLRNYGTAQRYMVPVGILVEGESHDIKLVGNRIHGIETRYNGYDGGDAHGIAVYGDLTNSIHGIVISENELFDLKLGSSEALVLNGNVENFEVSYNVVRDCNNIGIDFIGFEETGPTPSVDQARNGVCKGNLVFNIDSAFNPAYGGSFTKGGGDTSAGGIYVDGGANIIVEQNVVHDCNIGIELASEHSGRSTSGITVRNNLVYHNHIGGLFLGGYDRQRGMTRNCEILNNTFFENDTKQDGNGEIYLQFDVGDCTVKNNILFTNGQGLLIGNPYTENTNNTVDYNLFFSPNDAEEWQWKNTYYTDLTDYRNASGNDANSLLADPVFVDQAQSDWRLSSGSPARDVGDNAPDFGSADLDGLTRVENSVVDMGAFEYRASSPSAQRAVSGNGMSIVDGDDTPFSGDGTDLGDVVWNAGSVESVFEVTNNGSTVFRPTSFSIGGAGGEAFHFTGLFSMIPAGESRLVRVSFDPDAPGIFDGTVRIGGHANADSEYTFSVQGTGIRPDYLPDVQVGLRPTSYLGGNRYGGGQQARLKLRRRTGNVWFLCENDGALADTVRLRGTKKDRFFLAKYLREGGVGSANVTGAMVTGTESVPIASTASQRYRLKVKKSNRLDGRKKKRLFSVTAASVNDGAAKDGAGVLVIGK